jgi:c-di-GMP-binding flagellar brake protein YcgR
MPWLSRPSEQRRSPRFKANIPTVASLIRERDIVSFRARCDTISEGGVGARGRGLQSLVIGDLVALELYIPVSAHALSVNSVVRYIQGRRGAGRCGLQFQSLTEEQHNLIKRYCNLLPLKKRRWWS